MLNLLAGMTHGQIRRNTIYEFIINYIDENGYPPTLREIADGCDISSTSVVDYHLEKMEEMGMIKRVPKVARGIVVLDEGVA